MLYIILIISYSGNLLWAQHIVDRHPDTYLSITELANKYGYPMESHEVTTEDGYMLTMHRIPHGRNGSGASRDNKKVVLIVHGLMSQSEHFIANGMHNSSLAYLLSDNGYDVWLANCRGNGHSRKHVHLFPDQAKFWNFSWHEIGKYDLPAKIDYILGETKQDKLFYIAHSQGGTCFYVLCTERPEYQKKIVLASLMAPSAFLKHFRFPLLKTIASRHKMIMDLAYRYNMHEFPNKENSISKILTSLCVNSSIDVLCMVVLKALNGGELDKIDLDMLPLVFRFIPTGAIKQVVHYFQLISTGLFRQFDYGSPRKNMEIYDRPEPPHYPVENISVPVAFYYSKNDLLVDYRGVEYMCTKLPKCMRLYLMKIENWSHMDFTQATKLGKQLNVHILRFMQRYNQNSKSLENKNLSHTYS